MGQEVSLDWELYVICYPGDGLSMNRSFIVGTSVFLVGIMPSLANADSGQGELGKAMAAVAIAIPVLNFVFAIVGLLIARVVDNQRYSRWDVINVSLAGCVIVMAFGVYYGLGPLPIQIVMSWASIILSPFLALSIIASIFSSVLRRITKR